jgi:hypothetical protein
MGLRRSWNGLEAVEGSVTITGGPGWLGPAEPAPKSNFLSLLGNGGRLSFTSCLNREQSKAGIQVVAGDGGTIRSLDVWELKSIWPESKAVAWK